MTAFSTLFTDKVTKTTIARQMKKKLLTLLLAFMAVSMTAFAQSDVVPLSTALRIFQNPKQSTANDLLTKQGYQYKGVQTVLGQGLVWVKNMDLTKDGLPTKFAKGNSSQVILETKEKTLYLYVFNQACFKQLQQQAAQLGYKADNSGGKTGTTFYMKEDAPTLTFVQLEKPMPYCVIITE